MKIKEIIKAIETVAPLSYQETYDNAGLLTGNSEDETEAVLLTLDITEAVLKEAVSKGCNLIISHHPLVFKGLKTFTGKTWVERALLFAIKNNLAIYTAHTNLDNVLENGVNGKISEKLGLTFCTILKPKESNLIKLVTYCPIQYAEQVQQALWNAGAGEIGAYENCSFNMKGTGTFKGKQGSNPFIGEAGELEKVEEQRIEVVLESWKQKVVLKSLLASHPYEEVAYELYPTLNADQTKGSGMIGDLSEAVEANLFPAIVKSKLGAQVVKFTAFEEKISKVAVCGGSGRFLLEEAIKAGAQAFISADFKYHDYFEADNKLMICDIGHYESEIYTLEIFSEIIKEKFPKFAVIFTKTNTNPVRYYY